MKDLSVIDAEERLVGGFANVEVVDRQGEYVPVEALEKVMFTYMDRGGHLLFGHSNKPVGKILRWEVREHPEAKKPGIYIVGKIFKDYATDDAVWEMIKRGEITGFSIGGQGKRKMQKIESDGGKKDVYVIDDLELVEISLVPVPANQLARIDALNMVAKSANASNLWKKVAEALGHLEKVKKNLDEIQKPFGKWKNFDDCVSDMKAQGYSEESAKRICGSLQAKLEKSKTLEKWHSFLEESMKHVLLAAEALKATGRSEFSTLISELEALAERMYRMVMAEVGEEGLDDTETVVVSLKELKKDLRPPKKWWNRCIERTGRPALCGWVYFHHLKPEKPEGVKDKAHTAEARRRKRLWLEAKS